MSVRAFALLAIICTIWGFHFIVAKVAVSEAPPLYYAALRMSLLALVLAPFLRIHRGAMVRVLCAALCVGGINFGFFFVGVSYTTASVAALTVELGVPFATILSVIFLKERVGWRRCLGIAMALVGVGLIAFDPDELRFGLGAMLVAAGVLSESTGMIIVKTLRDIPPVQIQAWVGLVGAVILSAATLTFETGQAEALADASWVLPASVVYSAIGSSLIGHTTYYWLLRHHPVSMIAPFTLMCPLIALGFGVTLLGDSMTLLMAGGAVLALAGVGVILVRSGRQPSQQEAVLDAAPPLSNS